MRSGDEEARSPKYAHIERERRFLVDPGKRPDLVDLPFVEIEDRYLDGTRLRLRRMRDGASGAVVFKLTKKYETGDVRARPIVTAYLTEAEYQVFATLPARRLVKRRYKVGTEGGAFGYRPVPGRARRPCAGRNRMRRRCRAQRAARARLGD